MPDESTPIGVPPRDSDADIAELASDLQTVRHRLAPLEALGDGTVAATVQPYASLQVNAVAIGLGLDEETYNPSEFPGLRVHTRTGPVVAVFRTGHFVTVDASTSTDATRAIKEVFARVAPLGVGEPCEEMGKIDETSSIAPEIRVVESET